MRFARRLGPGDVLFARGAAGGRILMWEVRSVSIGAVGVEGLVELRSLSERPGMDVDGALHVTTWVPEALLRGMTVYTRLQATG